MSLKLVFCLLLTLLTTACAHKSVLSDIDKADKIVTNQAAPLSLKAKLMAKEGSTIRTPASLSASEINSNTEPSYDLLSSVTSFKTAGTISVDGINYQTGILSIGVGPDLNPEAMVLILNGGMNDSLSFPLPAYANAVKKISIKGMEVRAKITQRFETDKSPFYKDVPACFSVKLGMREVDQQKYLDKKAHFTIGECKEF